MADADPATQDELRQPPQRPHVMFQGWEELLFVHSAVEPQLIQRMLPAGLEVETFPDASGDPKAWIGIVPFRMRKIRGRFMPKIPYHHDFLELNVRTYVRGLGKWPAVFFFSLDCNRPLAVWGGRVFFGLPYFTSKLTFERDGDTIQYRCQRGTSGPRLDAAYTIHGETRTSRPGSLEHFLLERYLLISDRKSGLAGGRVTHSPYQFRDATLNAWDETFLSRLGIANAQPDHVAFCEGVYSKIWWLRKLKDGA